MDRQQTLYIDIDPKVLDGLKLGEDVTLTVKGKVKELRMREDYEMMPCGCMGAEKEAAKKPKEKTMASLSLKVSSVECDETNTFSKMAKEDDDE